MKRFTAMAAGAVMGSLAALGAGSTQAAITITAYQSGPDVIVDASGDFDLAALAGAFGFLTSGDPILRTNDALLRVGAGGNVEIYNLVLAGPTSFGARSTSFSPSVSTGSTIGVWGVNGTLYLPGDYASGAFISGSSTFADTTLAAMGLGEGVYTYSVGRESVTVTIGSGAAGVPEPAAWTLLIGGFGLAGGVLRQRKARVKARQRGLSPFRRACKGLR